MKGTLRRTRASGRGAGGQHDVSLEPMLGTSAANGFLPLPFATCWRRHSQRHQSPTQRDTMLTPKTTVRNNPPVRALETPHPPPEALSLVLEQMAMLNAVWTYRRHRQPLCANATLCATQLKSRPRLLSSYPHHHHTKFSTITIPTRSHTSLPACPTNTAPPASCSPCTVAHSSTMAIPKPLVVRHPFLLVNRSPTPIVGATMDTRGAAPPLTQWS
jgi:hypothetical protein